MYGFLMLGRAYHSFQHTGKIILREMGGLARSGGLHGRPVFSRCIFFLSRGGGGGGGLFLQGADAALFLLLLVLERPVLRPASGLAANLVLCRHLYSTKKQKKHDS